MVIIKPHDVGGKMNFIRGVLWATGGCPGFYRRGKTKGNTRHGFPPVFFCRGKYRLEIVIGYRNGQCEVDTLARNDIHPDTSVNKAESLIIYRSDYQIGSSPSHSS